MVKIHLPWSIYQAIPALATKLGLVGLFVAATAGSLTAAGLSMFCFAYALWVHNLRTKASWDTTHFH